MRISPDNSTSLLLSFFLLSLALNGQTAASPTQTTLHARNPQTTHRNGFVELPGAPKLTAPKFSDPLNILGSLVGVPDHGHQNLHTKRRDSGCQEDDVDCGNGYCCSAGTSCIAGNQCQASIGIGGIGIGLGSRPAYQGEDFGDEDSSSTAAAAASSTVAPKSSTKTSAAASTTTAPSSASATATATTGTMSSSSSASASSTTAAPTASSTQSPDTDPNSSSDSGISGGAIAGAIVAVLIVLALLGLISAYIYRRGKKAGARAPQAGGDAPLPPPKAEPTPMYGGAGAVGKPGSGTATYTSEVSGPISPLSGVVAPAAPRAHASNQSFAPSELDAGPERTAKFEMDGSAASAPLPAALRPAQASPLRSGAGPRIPRRAAPPPGGSVYEMPG